MARTNHDEFDALLDAVFGFARQQIERHGEFFPFAAVVAADGELRMIATQMAEERPLSQDVIDDLYRVLTAEAASGAIRAAAACADVLVTPPGTQTKVDALRADIEHIAGHPTQVFQPYKKKRLRGYEFEEIFGIDDVSRLRFGDIS